MNDDVPRREPARPIPNRYRCTDEDSEREFVICGAFIFETERKEQPACLLPHKA